MPIFGDATSQPVSDLPKDYVDLTVKYTKPGEYQYFVTFVVSLGERAAPTNDRNCHVLRVWAGDTLIIDRTRSQVKPGVNYTFYPGTQDQEEVYRGMHYRGQMCIKFTDFPVKDFNNSIPPITAEVVEGSETIQESGVIIGSIASPFGRAFNLELDQDGDTLNMVDFNQLGDDYAPVIISRRLSTKTTAGRRTVGMVVPAAFDSDQYLFTFVPGTDMLLVQAETPTLKQLVEVSTGNLKFSWGLGDPVTTNTETQFVVWNTALGFAVSGDRTDHYVIGTGVGDVGYPVGILSAQSNQLLYAWGAGEAFTDEPVCLTRGSTRQGEADIAITTATALAALAVGLRGTAPGLERPMVAERTLYAHTGSGTLWQTFYSPLDDTYVCLVDNTTEFYAIKVSVDGVIEWTSAAFDLPPAYTARERTMLATADLRGHSLVVKIKDQPGNLTYINTLTGAIELLTYTSAPDLDNNYPAIWESANSTLYSGDRGFLSTGVPVDTAYDVGDFMRQLSIRAGYENSDIFTDGMDGMTLDGFVISGPNTLAQVANQLSQLYGFNWIERAGQIIYKYNYDSVGELTVDMVVPPERLAQLNESEDAGHNAVSRQDDTKFPNVLSLKYSDGDNEYKPGYQVARRSNFPQRTQFSESRLDMVVPITLSGEKALAMLHQMMYRVWASKVAYAIRLPAEFIQLDGGDAIQFTADGYQYDAIVTKTTINADNSVSLALTEANAGSYPVAVETQEPIRPPKNIEGLPVNCLVLDIPNWKPEQDQPDLLNLWVLMSGYQEDDFNGGRLETALSTSPDDYDIKLSFGADEASHIGMIADTIAPNTNPWDVDTVGVIRVSRGSIPVSKFETATDEEMVAGKNLVAVGRDGTVELLCFGEFTIIDDETVEVSRLMRGRYGTEGNINEATTGDFFAFLDTAKPLTYTVAEFRNNLAFFWRAVSPGQPYWQVASNFITPQGNSRKPYGPVLVSALRLVNGDLGISWVRRARFYNSPDYDFAIPPPLDEPVESYIVDIMSPDWGTLLRRYSGQSRLGTLYPLADQIADQTNELDEINIVVFMVNSTHVGKGFPGGGGVTVGYNYFSVTFDLGGDMTADLRRGAEEAVIAVSFDGGGSMRISDDLNGLSASFDGGGSFGVNVAGQVTNRLLLSSLDELATPSALDLSGDMAPGDLTLSGDAI